ncbi:MAG: class II aldolase/adducin family protein [Sedimentisphaerales bacterium]|nr:class II aldolase/adducin family protein [Sedimentisphaerales bacterium]
MAQEYKEKIDEFILACHRVGRYGLLGYSSGNMSYRLDSDLVAVSGRGAWLGEITTEDVALCMLASGCNVAGAEPTAESAIHLGILWSRKNVNVVLHCQSPYATAIACGSLVEQNFNVIPEIPIYIGVPAVIDYLPPGSKELAKEVVSAMQQHDLAILRNHGQVVVGRDFNDAIQKAGFFELACRIILTQQNPTFIEKPLGEY